MLYRSSPTPDMTLEETSNQVVDQLMESLQTMTKEQEAEFQAVIKCTFIE